MILDAKLVLADAQAETTAAAHDSTNVIDFGAAGDPGYPLTLVVRVDTAPTSSGSATVTFGLSTSADNSTYASLYTSAAIGYATLTKGYELRIPVPTGMKQYLKGVITIGTAALTAGKFDMFLVPKAQTNTYNV